MTLDAAAAIFVVIVGIITVWYGRRSGILTALASAIAYNFFFIEPVLAFSFPPQGEEYVLWASVSACATLLPPFAFRAK